MTFAHPYIMLWIWAVPLLLVLFLMGRARRRSILGRYVTQEGLERIAGQASPDRRWIKAVLGITAFALMVIALAGPRYGYKWETVERRGVDIVVALDCSRSMLAEDIDPNRLLRAKREIIDLLDRLFEDRIGLVAFAGNAFVQCPLTLDGAAFEIFLKALDPGFLPVGGTNLAAALETALSAFDAKSPADKAVILITDGEQTVDGDPVAMAKTASDQGIKIFCIGVGGESGAPVPGEGGGFKKDRSGRIVLSRLDEATLKRIADLTDGVYVRSVAGDMDLDVIYDDHIQATMADATFKGGKKQVWENRFQWFLGIALLCLGIAQALPSVRQKSLVVILVLVMVSAGGPAGAGSIYGDVRQGRDAYEKGAYEEALKHFIDAQLHNPENPSLYYNIGNAYYKMGRHDEALRQYEKALSFSTENAFRKKLQYNRGNARFRKGDFQGAIDAYQKALAIDPEDRLTKDNLALANEALKQQQKQQQAGQEHSDSRRNNETGDKQPQAGNTTGDAKQQQGMKDTPQKGGSDQNDQRMNEPQPQPLRPEEDKDTEGQSSTMNQEGAEDQKEKANNGSWAEGASRPGNMDPAERRLNRLKDKPGAALVPAYKGPPIEKDW